ncbi:MAG TPA: hypothetical protein VF719_04290, partial [Abditibacteriaceae bacterium]
MKISPPRRALWLTSLVCLLGIAHAFTPQPWAPAVDTLFTSTRGVNHLTVGPDGALWAATNGGVLRHAQGQWRK